MFTFCMSWQDRQFVTDFFFVTDIPDLLSWVFFSFLSTFTSTVGMYHPFNTNISLNTVSNTITIKY